jgi:hypothetical protein
MASALVSLGLLRLTKNRGFSPWGMLSYPAAETIHHSKCHCHKAGCPILRALGKGWVIERSETVLSRSAKTFRLNPHPRHTSQAHSYLDTHDKINSGTNSPAQAGLHHLKQL